MAPMLLKGLTAKGTSERGMCIFVRRAPGTRGGGGHRTGLTVFGRCSACSIAAAMLWHKRARFVCFCFFVSNVK